MNDQPDIIWQPTADRANPAEIISLAAAARRITGRIFESYEALHTWSVKEPAAFWSLVWDECGVIGNKGSVILENPHAMPGARWFPDARLNYAENLLRARPADQATVVFRGENGARSSLSFGDLCAAVSRLAQALDALGLRPGDRVAAYMPNCPEALIAMLAATSRGLVFSSASPDFGVAGALDRFGQIEPKVLFTVDGYRYAGKELPILDKVAAIARRLPSLVQTVVVNFLASHADLPKELEHAATWEEVLAVHSPRTLSFVRVPFDHPLFILYSSGTTGVPKCIVHGHGGTLLQHLKEHRYHCDIRPHDRVFYFTTLGWMMWNWLVSALALRATLILFDGSPTHPRMETMFELAQSEQVTLFGTSAKFIDAIKKAALNPRATFDFPSLRTICSTGSPLAPDAFDFIYEAVKPDVHLASMSGGTDILGCFVTGVPTLPVRRGEIQAAALGMATKVFDDTGRAAIGQKGELVCTTAFPSMPIGFWNDPEGRRYRAAYFERYENAWTHGDWAEQTPSGGFVIYGRSDATLNPGGVRIGTAEIYRQVESIAAILESVVVGQDWNNDVRVVLFVVLRNGTTLDEGLIAEIKTRIRSNCTPRHVPSRIIAVPAIPRTKSGKIVELAVRDVIHGRPVKNVEALANPDALDFFRGLEIV